MRESAGARRVPRATLIVMERTRRNPVVTVLAVLATGGVLLLIRRARRHRVGAGSSRRGDDGGGLAGVREPRRPLPKDLVGAAAAEPGE